MASNAALLRQRVGPWNVAAMAGNAALLRQCVGSRSDAAMAGNALDLTAVLRCSAARYNFGQCCTVAFLFFCFFFTLDNLKREKEWEKERSFDTCSLVS
jgi:hypothetical protein